MGQNVGSNQADAVGSGAADINPESYEARTLKQEIKESSSRQFDTILTIAIGLTTALGHLHRHGLIHRDVKLANIIFVNGVPKLADIGLVTETGSDATIVGTEGYMPPEGSGTVVGDIYSLGKVFYELVTGNDRSAFPEFSSAGLDRASAQRMRELQTVVMKACSINPAARYASTDELLHDLMRLKTGQSVIRLRDWERVADFNSRFGLFNVIRVTGVGLFTLKLLFTGDHHWRDATLSLYISYFVFAVAAALLCLLSEKLSRWNTMAIPFVDMPIFFLIQWAALLHATGQEGPENYAVWANGLVGISVAIFILMIMMATLSEREWLIAVSTIVAIGLEWALMARAGQTVQSVMDAFIILALAGAVCAFAKKYAVDLVPLRA